MGDKSSQAGRDSKRKSPAADQGNATHVGRAPGAEIRVPLATWKASLVLWLASVGLLALAFPPARWAWVAHVALTPMLLAVARAPRWKVLLGSSALAGLVFYGGEMYWMSMVDWAAYGGVVAYCLALWVLFAVLLKWTLDRTRWPLVVLAPLIWVTVEWSRSWLLTGFPWLFLGHPQAACPTLLQLADVAGPYGLSALSAATAGFLADLLTHPLFLRYGDRVRLSRTIGISLVVLAALWAVAIAYGMVRLQPTELPDGPVVAVVQTNVPQHVKEHRSDEESDRQFQEVLDLTEEAIRNRPDAQLLVWPETTVGDINPWLLNYPVPTMKEAESYPHLAEQIIADRKKFEEELERDRRIVRRAQSRWEAIHRLSRDRQVDLLIGATSQESDARFNSAYLFRPEDGDVRREGTTARSWWPYDNRYDKVHLVPFGEYVPFQKSAPWLYDLLHGFTPYDYDYNLMAGRQLTVMTTRPRSSAGEPPPKARFAAPICFEDAFSGLCRDLVYEKGEKRVDFLVNISNDGWFYGSVELDQHWDLSVFRAVENRVPVVRSVNTGLSGFIDSCGRTELRVANSAGDERSVAGSASLQLQFDPRRSFYGLHGDVFAHSVAVATGLVLLVATVRPRRSKAPGEPGKSPKAKKEKTS
jgi:apolipoprotein N-acyltransferase